MGSGVMSADTLFILCFDRKPEGASNTQIVQQSALQLTLTLKVKGEIDYFAERGPFQHP